ncbi:MAG TPA: hypothetical protein VMW41_02645 [Candidatus Bathyarchaeia archaeon]|nr:hypothetical protein [Candidatus Bathyarchaeia archaeon]
MPEIDLRPPIGAFATRVTQFFDQKREELRERQERKELRKYLDTGIEVIRQSAYSQEIPIVDPVTQEMIIDKEEQERSDQAKQNLEKVIAEIRWRPPKEASQTFRRKELRLEDAWERAWVWQMPEPVTGAETGLPEREKAYFLAFDVSVRQTYSAENFKKAGYSAEQAKKLAAAVAFFFAAQAGVKDVPLTAVVRLDRQAIAEIDPRMIGNFGDKLSPSFDRSREEDLAQILRAGYQVFAEAYQVFESDHGWSADRWAMMAEPEKIRLIFEAMGQGTVAIFPSSMGIEEGTEDWRIDERNCITPRDYALSWMMVKDILGLYFDFHLTEAHSAGGQMVFPARQALNQRLSKNDEQLVNLCKKKAGRAGKGNWKVHYARLSEEEKWVPSFAWIICNPALHYSNYWLFHTAASRVLTAALMLKGKIDLEAIPVPLNLPEREARVYEAIVANLVPKVAIEALQEPVTDRLLKYYLQFSPPQVLSIHKENINRRLKVVIAQANGLAYGVDPNNLRNNKLFVRQTLKMLTDFSAYQYGIITTAEKDRLVDLKALLEILSGAEEMITEAEEELILMTSRTLGINARESMVRTPIVGYFGDHGDHDHYIPLDPEYWKNLPAAFYQPVKEMADFRRKVHHRIPVYCRNWWRFDPWVLLTIALSSASPGKELLVPEKRQEFWDQNPDFGDTVLAGFMKNWELNRKQFDQFIRGELPEPYPTELLEAYDQLSRTIPVPLINLGIVLTEKALCLRKRTNQDVR